MPLGDKVRQLDEQVATVVRRAMEDLREEVRKRLDEATEDLRRRLGEVAPELPDSFVNEEDLQRIAEEAAAPSREALADAESRGARAARTALREAVAALDRATTQSSVLDALLAESSRFAPRAAILLARDGGIAGWDARGFESEGGAARAVELSATEEPWSSVVHGGPARAVAAARCASLVSQLDSPMPLDGAVIPLVLRDRVAALLYADRREATESIDLDALQLLTYAAGLALETLALRERSSTATLLPAEASGAPAPAPETVTPVEAELEEAAAAAAETEVEEKADEPEVWQAPEPTAEEAASETVTLDAWEEQDLELSEPALTDAEEAEEEAGGEPWSSGIEVAPAAGSAETPEPVEATEETETAGEVEIDLEGAEEIGLSSDLLQPVDEEELEPVERPVAGFESLDDRVLGEAALAEAPELEEEAPTAETGYEPVQEPESRGEAIPWRTEESDAFAPEEAEIELTADEVAGAADIGLAADEDEDDLAGVEVAEAEAAEEEPAAEVEPETSAEPEVELEAAPEVEAEEVAAEAESDPEAAATGGWEESQGSQVSEPTETEAAPPPAPRAPSIGQVEPPADLEGPGWAFSSSRVEVSKDDEASHEEARRLARLLVSEIQLYNQDEVEEGRRNRDIYERLRDDIDRSRQLYEDRVEASVRDSTDYFYQELVRQLAAGDAKALGI